LRIPNGFIFLEPCVHLPSTALLKNTALNTLWDYCAALQAAYGMDFLQKPEMARTQPDEHSLTIAGVVEGRRRG
jgi:hypothetical protein